jgi:hypothetical protein
MSFQKVVNLNQAPGVLGDFASTNPFSSVTAAQGALVAPVGGLTVGNFFWVGPAGQTSQSFVSGWQIAFLGRNEQALITQFLGEATLVVPEGFMVTGFNGGDFWAYFAEGATALAQVYADEVTGEPQMQTTNTVTGEVGFTGTASFATNVMTVVTNTSGIILPGDVVTSATVTGGTTILAQLTGLPGAVGSTYSLSTAPGTIATQAATTASDVLNVTALVTGSLSAGDTITGTGVTAGTTIAQQLSGPAGGVGTYLLDIPGGVPFHTASEIITGPANTIATGWTVGPITLTGAGIAKISAAAV